MKTPEVFLLHAYSPRNSGDGLLVKLSLRAIRSAGIVGPVTVVCLDKAAFAGYLDDTNVELISLAQFVVRIVRRIGSMRAAIFFGVGGGYLRSGTLSEGWKALIAHGTQIAGTALGGRRSRTVYLPQSVGPFKGMSGVILKALIRRHVDTIFLRDDKSREELQHRRGVRTGDLVVLEIGKHLQIPAIALTTQERRKVFFVFRDLSGKPYSEVYLKNIRRLVELIPDAGFALQSSGRGNSDDVFYQRTFGVQCNALLRDIVLRRDAIIVSVRLHGSLESVLAGVPSVHLSYERKGHAAYSDLGIDDYVFHAADFDPVKVADTVERLRNDPTPFWNSLDKASANRYDELVEYIKNEVQLFDHATDGRKLLARRSGNL